MLSWQQHDWHITDHSPTSRHCFIFIPPENVRKPLVFQEVKKWSNSLNIESKINFWNTRSPHLFKPLLGYCTNIDIFRKIQMVYFVTFSKMLKIMLSNIIALGRFWTIDYTYPLGRKCVLHVIVESRFGCWSLCIPSVWKFLFSICTDISGNFSWKGQVISGNKIYRNPAQQAQKCTKLSIKTVD